MDKKFQKALFIFRRDLRLEDNTGLIFSLKNAKEVIPCFIFTPEQIDDNSYKSDHCLQFMIESLEDLEDSIKEKNGNLYFFKGKPEMVLEECIAKLNIDLVVVNRDYTPYSRTRDRKIETVCKKLEVSFLSFDDALLNPPEKTLKADGTPYVIFTPFYRNALQLPVAKPISNMYDNFYSGPIVFSQKSDLFKSLLPKSFLKPSGGRRKALNILKHIDQYRDYKLLRDFPAEDKTTHLSSHLKFTTCSPREVYWSIVKQLGTTSDLIRSLYWRDFFSSIAFYFPEVFSGAFHRKYDGIQWKNDLSRFKSWCEGKTGFPIIDAGMREMNQTGFMHNRVRMIVASFLVKDLHIDWRKGERYFAQTLIDYDPAINNGNWQWAASTGCDAQPYFRIFNPWTQGLKFDPECIYIKRWIPELASQPVEAIHNWYLDKHHSYSFSYPAPIVDHAVESKLAIEYYKSAFPG